MTKKTKWVVRHCFKCQRNEYLYGKEDFEDWECTACGSKGYTDIDEPLWDAEAIAVIAGNDLEDANQHSLVNVPEGLLHILRENKLSEEKVNKILRDFVLLLRRNV
jgi:hypothetical protein